MKLEILHEKLQKQKNKKHPKLHFCLKPYVKNDIFEKKLPLVKWLFFKKKLNWKIYNKNFKNWNEEIEKQKKTSKFIFLLKMKWMKAIVLHIYFIKQTCIRADNPTGCISLGVIKIITPG